MQRPRSEVGTWPGRLSLSLSSFLSLSLRGVFLYVREHFASIALRIAGSRGEAFLRNYCHLCSYDACPESYGNLPECRPPKAKVEGDLRKDQHVMRGAYAPPNEILISNFSLLNSMSFFPPPRLAEASSLGTRSRQIFHPRDYPRN